MKNYHTHTYLCRHAEGAPIDYVKEAYKLGFSSYGISCHAPIKILIDRGSKRMKESEYPLYIEMLNEAAQYAKGKMRFYKGLEIEYFDFALDMYPYFLKEMDYLILGQHYIVLENGKLLSTYALQTLEHVILYRDLVMKALKTGYFNVLCHPDLCFFNIPYPTKDMVEVLRPLIKLAKELKIPLEVNANGFRKTHFKNGDKREVIPYPRIDFFKMVKEEGAKVILQNDAHSLDAIYDWAMIKGQAFIKELGLEEVEDIVMYVKS